MLKDANKAFVADIDELNEKSEKVATDISNMNYTLNGIIKPVIAVKVRLSTDKTFAPGQRIIYDSIITNEGGAYSSTSGTFLAPVNGVYVFAVKTCAHGGYWNEVAIINGGVEIANAVARNYGCGSDTTTVNLKAGSEVWVNYNMGSYGTLRAVHWCTFTAVLVA